jgi:multiple sugar transport system substrate-binding protein
MSKISLTRREFLKAASAVVASAASGAVLSSCAPGPTAVPPAPTVGALAATAAPAVPTVIATRAAGVPKADPINILINDSPWYPGFEKLVNLYQQNSGNTVKLAVTPFTGMLDKTRNAVTASESEFDIVNLNEAWYATFYAGKFIAPLQSIDPNFKLDPNVIEYNYATRWNHDKKYSTSDGTLYGLPINGNIQLLYYRKDLFDAAGLSAPVTWADVDAAAKKLESPPNMYGFSMRGQKAGWATGFDWFGFLRSYGGDWVAKPGTDWTVTINNAAAKQAMKECLDLLKAHAPANVADIGQAEMVQLMTSGKLAQGILVVAAFPSMDDPKQSMVVNKVDVTVMPKSAGGKPGPTSGIWVMGIPNNLPDKRKQAALTFLNWALSKDAQTEYTKFGAVPVRQDVYTSDLANEPAFRWMKAMGASTPYIAESVRIPEGTQVTDSIELHVNQAIAGQMSGDDAVDTMAKEIYNILQKAGYPTKLP